MKTLLVAFPILLFIASVASSQSLADVARKERQRRDENAKQGVKTAFEAEGVGSFGRVWWRDPGKTATDEAQTTDATPADEPSMLSASETSPTGVASAVNDDGTLSKRGDLPLRKTNYRPRH